MSTIQKFKPKGGSKDPEAAPVNSSLAAEVASETQEEIEQIMGEIEELQKGMSTAEDPQGSAPVSSKPRLVSSNPNPVPAADSVEAELVAVEEDLNLLQEFRANAVESNMEETLADLKDDGPSGPSLLDEVTTSSEEAESADSSGPAYEAEVEAPETETEEEEVMSKSNFKEESGEESLTLTLKGTMKLKLKYEFEGQEVSVGFSDGSLRVELSDGTEFKIPVRRGSQKRAA